MTKEEAIDLVKQDAFALENLDIKFKNAKDVVLTAVNTDGFALKYASDELKNDREIVMAALSNNGGSLEYVSDELKKDKEIVFIAISHYGWEIKHATEKLKNDKEIVLAAVKKSGDSLQYASEKLRNDKDVILAALSNHVSPLQYASKEIRNNKYIIMHAVKIDNIELDYVDYKWQEDEDIKQLLKCSFQLITDELTGLCCYESTEHKLQVAIEDLPESLSWDEAMLYCEKIGKGWRLPTRKEFYFIYKELHLKNVCPIQSDWYWTKERDGYRHFDENAFCFQINRRDKAHKKLPHSDRDLDRTGISAKLSVRIVRTI
jgi:CxxC motif-containing protein